MLFAVFGRSVVVFFRKSTTERGKRIETGFFAYHLQRIVNGAVFEEVGCIFASEMIDVIEKCSFEHVVEVV